MNINDTIYCACTILVCSIHLLLLLLFFVIHTEVGAESNV